MKNYTLSLSRWHKVAERLSRAYVELTHSARDILTNAQVGGYFGHSQLERLKSEAERARLALQRAFAIQDVIAAIRQEIGEANSRTGVGRLLAKHDALSRRHKLLDTVLAAQSSEMVTLDELPNLPRQIVNEDRYDRSRAQIRVRVLGAEALEAMKQEADALLVSVYALADQISDLNRERLSIDLPEDVAAAGGL
jgi:SpoVK/Ycf46/Vps4 family AAA+-type ATPase